MRLSTLGIALAASFLLAGSFGWVVFFALFSKTFGQDWMVFDTAARAYWHGDVGVILDGGRLTRLLNDTHPTLQQPLVFRPWVYPPYTLLLVLPFGLVSWPLSYGGFQLLTFAAMAFALRQWAPDNRRFWIMLAGVALFPAAAYNLGAGQNGFLSAALLLGGISLLGPRPFIAGLLLGVLAYKPQFGLLIPVALVAGGAWRAIGGATVSVTLLIIASLAVPGLAIWQGWLHLFLASGDAPRQWVELYGQSVFTYMRLAGFASIWADAGQAIALLIGAAAVLRAFRVAHPPLHRIMVLLCAISFSAPHFGDYDAIFLGILGMLILCATGRRPPTALAIAGCVVWCSTAINPPFLFKQTLPPVFILAELTPFAILYLLVQLSRSSETADSISE